MGQWYKLGQICEGITIGDWAAGYAAVPTAVHQGADIYRVYVSARDTQQRSRPAWFDFDIASKQITDVCTAPVLALGGLGTFDDSGVMPTWVLPQADGDLMYYVGWNQSVTVPFRNSVGLAKQDARGAWHKMFRGPVLDRSREEPYFVASCAVLEDGDIFHNWYLTCTGWSLDAGKPKHHYHIKYASSPNAIDWDRNGDIAIDYVGDEYAISRPSVLRGKDGQFHMWFSARGAQYQIYKATSADGKNWTREAEPAVSPSPSGWDADMACYPFVFDHDGARYMLYNGNGYGQSGVGLAQWEAS